MNTFKGIGGSTFFFNSDFSGEVIIEDDDSGRVTIEGKAILEFVALCYVQSKKIEQLEQMCYEELLINETPEWKRKVSEV